MGWMSDWLYANKTPTSPWRGSDDNPTRALSLETTPDGIRLVQKPAEALNALRRGKVAQ